MTAKQVDNSGLYHWSLKALRVLAVTAGIIWSVIAIWYGVAWIWAAVGSWLDPGTGITFR